MSTVTSDTQVEVLHPVEVAPEPVPGLDAGTIVAARRVHNRDNWALIALVLCGVLFAGAFAMYVFHPAMTTLTASSAEGWKQGP